MSKYRKIKISGETWLWKAGEQNVSIKSPDGTGHAVPCHILKGQVNLDDFDRGKHKRTIDGMVKPGYIGDLIGRTKAEKS